MKEVIKTKTISGKKKYRYYDDSGTRALGPWRDSKKSVVDKDVKRVAYFKNKKG